MSLRPLAALVAAALLWPAGTADAGAGGSPAALCEQAARVAAHESGVPLALLRAVMTAESGRGSPASPWPWTIQSGGRGHWLPDRAAARALAADLVAGGQDNVDLGCFQINLRWHGARFRDLDAMLDPLANARYAAAYLTALHVESGDWREAAGAYHSRDPARAESYVVRLVAAHAGAAPPDLAAPPPASPRRRAFALAGARGPLLAASRGPLIGMGG